MNHDIQVGKTGVVLSGDNIAWQVRVEDDSVNTGGFLILASSNFADPSAEAFDDWVEDEAALQGYFRESGWVIKWF